MRRFHLYRRHDVTGVSGQGVVAEGVQFEDGAIAIRWRGRYRSTVVWDRADGLDAVLAVHGHDGATTVEWFD